jgi:exopolyphosphatase / guanosine-5'-triphosphate,3'-diphosphate pyrophosphatase
MRFAVLDLGSTSFQLLVSDVEDDGALTHVLRDRVILNLGAEVAATGSVPEDQLDRALFVVRRFRDVAERSGAERVIPVATAAFRDAANRPELARAIALAAGTPVRVLAGDEEARCTVAGIRASVALDDGQWVGLDLGGGSLEIAVVRGDRVTWTDTYPLGAARLSRTLVSHDPVSRAERHEIRDLVHELLTGAVEASGAPKHPVTVLAGGTAGAVARLLAARRWPSPPASLNQFEVGIDDLVEVSRTLCALPLSDRLRLPGFDERRADILPAGAVVLATALQVFDVDRAVHAEWGLREGVILREIRAQPPASPEEMREASIQRLVRRWGTAESHPKWVLRHALRLFDETSALHELGPHERQLLSYASQLHDIGARISPDKHHKHGAYLVEHAGLRGFTPSEVAMVASMIRFHRGAGPRTTYPPYAGLTAEERESVRILTGILRLAHGLGRGGEGDVVEIGTRARRKELLISVAGLSNPDGAVAEAEERADVLASALGLRVRFEVVPVGTLTP